MNKHSLVLRTTPRGGSGQQQTLRGNGAEVEFQIERIVEHEVAVIS